MAAAILERTKGVGNLSVQRASSETLEESGGYGPESGSAWRQLLERGEELSFRLPQRERSLEPEPDDWLPFGRSSQRDGLRESTQPSSGRLDLEDAGMQAPDASSDRADALANVSGAILLTRKGEEGKR